MLFIIFFGKRWWTLLIFAFFVSKLLLGVMAISSAISIENHRSAGDSKRLFFEKFVAKDSKLLPELPQPLKRKTIWNKKTIQSLFYQFVISFSTRWSILLRWFCLLEGLMWKRFLIFPLELSFSMPGIRSTSLFPWFDVDCSLHIIKLLYGIRISLVTQLVLEHLHKIGPSVSRGNSNGVVYLVFLQFFLFIWSDTYKWGENISCYRGRHCSYLNKRSIKLLCSPIKKDSFLTKSQKVGNWF